MIRLVVMAVQRGDREAVNAPSLQRSVHSRLAWRVNHVDLTAGRAAILDPESTRVERIPNVVMSLE
jgi:hypothetical protein